ncbi:hypothetical protein BDV93DRAFT_157861 [Ceratobasidium sp. AG-I]|nr:hypothetical protein BDV93DRAFT_157861 [Ceratobasidium sp. AG-I]
MSSRSSYLSGLEPDPHISASGLQYSGLTSEYCAHVPGRDVFAPCEGAVLPMLLGSKFEPKAKGFCGYQVDTTTPKTYAIKEGSHEELCSPNDVNIEVKQAYHEEKGSIQLEVATRISAPCPDESSDLVPTAKPNNEGCSCGPLMFAFNGFCEHRSQSIHSFGYEDEDDEEDDGDQKDTDEYNESNDEEYVEQDVEHDDNGQDVGNRGNVGKDAEEKNNHEWNIEPSGACVRDEGNQFTEQVSPVELLESGLRNDLADIISFTDEPLAPSHQSLLLCDLLPPKSPEPDGGLDDATIRSFKALDPIVELVSYSPFPILYYTNAPVLDPNRQLCAEHPRHSRTFGLGGGGLCRKNRGWITTARNRRAGIRLKCCRGMRMLFYVIVRPNPSAPTIHHPASNQPLSYLLGLLTISSSFGDGYSRLLAFRRGVYILQRHVVIHLSGNLPHDSAHLHLTGNHRYRTNASGSSGSGSPSEQGNFNSSSGDECWDEYSSGEYGAGDIFDYPQNYSVVDGDVLSEGHNYQLSPGRHATEYYQTLNSNQFGDSQALPVHSPSFWVLSKFLCRPAHRTILPPYHPRQIMETLWGPLA